MILLFFLPFPFQEDETDVSEEVKEAWVSDTLVDTVPLSSALLLGTADLCECGQRVKTSLALSSVTGACWGLFFLCSSTAMLLNDFPVPTVLAASHRHPCRCHICPLTITGLGKVLGNLWKRSKK